MELKQTEEGFWYEDVRCVTCNETLKVPVEVLHDGPFKHSDCPDPRGY